MTPTDAPATAAVDAPRPGATGSILAYCAFCERYAAVDDVRVDDVVGEGPAHVCGDCRAEKDGAEPTTVSASGTEAASGRRGAGSDEAEPIVPHTGQSTSVVTSDELP